MGREHERAQSIVVHHSADEAAVPDELYVELLGDPLIAREVHLIGFLKAEQLNGDDNLLEALRGVTMDIERLCE